jgi:hypothetical protein
VIEDALWARLLGFIGYGRREAPWWFIGLEPGTKGHTADNWLHGQAGTTADVVDLGEACRAMGFSRIHSNPTWAFISLIAVTLRGDTDAGSYLQQRMGRINGETLLLEVLPLAASGVQHWPSAYQERWPTRDDYEREARPHRVELLARLIADERPELVVGYGKGNWGLYEKLTPSVEWRNETVVTTSIRYGRRDKTMVVLTEGPTSRSMNARDVRNAVANRIKELLEPL